MAESGHRYPRSFFGPTPENVLTQLQKKYGRNGTEATSNGHEVHTNSAASLIEKHAFTFFLSEGGLPEDWDEEAQSTIKKKMMRRWLESEWSKVLHKQDHEQERTPDRWIGDSFEIGDFLGIDTLSGHRHSEDLSPERLPQSRDVPQTKPVNGTCVGSTSSVPGVRPEPGEQSPIAGPSSAPIVNERRTLSTAAGDASVRVTQHALGDYYARPESTHNADNATDISLPTSAVPLLTESNTEEHVLRGTSILLLSVLLPSLNIWRDRMLVQVYYSETVCTGQIFNEAIHRTSRDLEYEAWGEFLVVWRRDCVEIYEDYNFPLREWISGHKRLAFTIPLSSTTRLSLYSFVDLTFSITCPVHDNPSRSRLPSFLSREGSRYFIFKLKSRSRAYDWIWRLWLRLGGRIPKTLEVKNPTLNATVSIDVPSADGSDYEKIFNTFSRQNVIDMSIMGLSTLPDWGSLIQLALGQGKNLELAWRIDTNLDWIWLETDIDEKVRKWVVLCGLIAKESTKGAVLELRLAEHYPAHIYLKNGDRIDEPSGVEGYLKRIRPMSLNKRPTYLSTHDGNLFVLPVDRAYPPTPPGFIPNSAPNGASVREAEIHRGAMQIMHASGVCDLRRIVAVRRAFQLVPPHVHDVQDGHHENDGPVPQGEEPSPDDEDRDEEVDNGSNKHLHMRRSFELLLEDGKVIRFEAHSRRVALQWINRLRALTSYWKERHRHDAQHEMDLAQVNRPRLTPLMPKCGTHAPLKLQSALASLVTMYTTSNWCMIQGCRPILRGGKLFMKKGYRGQYKLVQMFLVANHLVRYRIGPRTLLHPTMKKKVCLTDAHVCSGYWAAIALPDGEFDPCNPPVGRRYQDGLEIDDREEDTMFMVYYRSPDKNTPNSVYHNDFSPGVPSISAKRKTLFFRTRSKLERDSWCWAINCEIEKTVRMHREREEAIRKSGNLIP